ncbi:MAG: 2-succinyl-5-enolpyruvyl-6-hydroxy-3-cyclohexene-1-carboxylic-acid synthase [Actinomycetaceae bacterium]|nr:2-succinyl-5-enolpyruvyl-6-hydroxy-3-cyclohexene-1-carboxylic-acid synthase [Actinomycetaceae bacterium]
MTKFGQTPTPSPTYGTDSSATRARDILSALISVGVHDFVICPGSRNAPLTYALAAHERAGLVRLHVRVDERTAGFFALGMSRAKCPPVPVAVVTTSGSAVANLAPALSEARATGLPLVALTADRPATLRGSGANQTTLQAGIFGTLVCDEVDLAPTTQTTVTPDPLVVGQLRRLVAGASGPVHVNAQFENPLASPAAKVAKLPPFALPRPTFHRTLEDFDPEGTVVVAGDSANFEMARRVVDFATDCGLPILAEPSSGARYGTALAHYPHYLADLCGEIRQIIQVGRPTLSRPVAALLADASVRKIVLAEGPNWVDSTGTAQEVIFQLPPVRPAPPQWLTKWQQFDEDAATSFAPRFAAEVIPGEAFDPARAAVAVWDSVAEVPDHNPLLYVAASAGVRNLDKYAPVYASQPQVYANRGLAGIDGIISSARGLAAGSDMGVRVLVGDLAFVHDLGGLVAGKYEDEVDLQVVVLNDEGGSIFAGLEHGDGSHRDDFPRFFATPQRLNIGAVAAGVGAQYYAPTSFAQLELLLAQPVRGLSIIEVDTAVPNVRALESKWMFRKSSVNAQ